MVKISDIRMAQQQLRKIFVYGTLKQKEPNHHWLTDTSNGFARFLSRATTTRKMPLIIATRYNIPFLLNKPGQGNYVAGEIYEVDDKMMDGLDNLEDCPNLYEREIQDMNIGIGEGTMPCWIYLLKKFPEQLLKHQFISEYNNSKEHPYVERSKRVENYSAIADLEYRNAASN